MRSRFKTDLQDSLYARKSKHLTSKNNVKVKCEEPKLINTYTAENKSVHHEFTNTFNKFLENNIKKVLFHLDKRPLAARARELSSKYEQAYKDLNESSSNLHEGTTRLFVCNDSLPVRSSENDELNFKKLIERTKHVPKYSPKEGDANAFGKSLSYYKHWLPESSEIGAESLGNSLLFQSINRQRDYSNISQNFELGLRDKAGNVKVWIEEKSKKFAKDVGLSPTTEDRLRLELKGSEGLHINTKWFERTQKSGLHSEKHVRELLKPWMKDGLPSTKSVIQLSKMRFYKRIYFDILDGCCTFRRGRQSVEEKHIKEHVLELLKRKSGGMYEKALYKRWLKNLRISQAITSYTREFSISFNEFNTIHENLFRTVAKSAKAKHRNALVESYWKKYRKQISEEDVCEADDGVDIRSSEKQDSPLCLLPSRSRKRVHKKDPFSSYDSHVLSAMRRRFTLANSIARKYNNVNVMVTTYSDKHVELSHNRLCDIGHKRIVLCTNSHAAIFNKLHKKFLKKSATLCPNSEQSKVSFVPVDKLDVGLINDEASTRNINLTYDGGLKMKKLFRSRNTFDGSRRDKANESANFLAHDYFENRFSKDPIRETEDFKLRNYNRICKGEIKPEPCLKPQMISKDSFFFRDDLETNYPRHRYEAAVNIYNDFYTKINESREHYLGYTLELFYWIRAFFEEYRHIKKNLPPLNPSFRKAFLPDPYLHFCPITKMPVLDWMVVKLQNSEQISKRFCYGSVSSMEAENIKSWNGFIDSQKCFLTGIKYFYNIRRFMAFKGLPCSSCYPDFQEPPENPGSSDESSWMRLSSRVSKEKQTEEPQINASQSRKICCGLIENSAFIRPENNLLNTDILQDDPKVFSKILQKLLSEIKIFGNIHRTKEQKFKENILAPVISASKDFFWKYYREYLCLFTKEPTVLGYLYNCKVVKRYKDDSLLAGITDDITHRRKSSKTIKAKPKDKDKPAESNRTITRGLNRVSKKYFSDEMDYDLNQSYTLHKFKDMSALGSDFDLGNFKSEILNELLEHIEYALSEECIDTLTNNDAMRDKVLEKLVTQDSDDSEWTIFENKKREKSEELRGSVRMSVTPSDMSLVQYESDSPKSVPDENVNAPISTSFSEKTMLEDEQFPTNEVWSETPLQEPAVVAYAVIETEISRGPEERFDQKNQHFSASKANSSAASERAASAKMVSDGDVFRRSFTFQFPENKLGFPNQSDPSILDLHYVHDDESTGISDVEVDSQPLAYKDVIKQVPSEIGPKRKQNKIEGLRKTFSAMTFPSEAATVLSDLESDKSETELCDYALNEEKLDDRTIKNIWFYDQDGKPQKHLTRTNRRINVDGRKIYPVEGVLTTQWYYSELAQHAAKKKVLHLVINCWNNHFKKWFKRLETEKEKATQKEQNKLKRMASTNSKHKVLWSSRKICIDNDFRKKVFTPTEPDTCNQFYKNSYNAVQGWIHKTHVTPDHSKSGWFEDMRNKEEKKIKELEEQIRNFSEADPESSAEALKKIREHHLRKYGSEFNTYSSVWERFWRDWEQGRYTDVLDPSMYDAGLLGGDSEDESAYDGDLVLGFPEYAKRRTDPIHELSADYERYTANKRFYDELLEDLKNAMAERNSSTDALYIQSVCKSALLQ